MISDSIPKASIFMGSSNPKDSAKKKKANRSAKMKQCKLDARREQWLSQVKNKGGSCKEEVMDGGILQKGPMCIENKRGIPVQKLELKVGAIDIFGDVSPTHHYSDSESWLSNSPVSLSSSSVLSLNDSGVNFTESSRSSSSSRGCFSGSMSEEDEEGCLDDWEAMADALAATSDEQQEKNLDPDLGSPPSEKLGNNIPKGKQESRGEDVQQPPAHRKAWMPDDAFRPQSLPDLSKQYGFQFDTDCRFGRAGSVWGFKNVEPVPASCPICCEDLDCTDSSFLPCLCGFRLCLFCHKRILEGDGRCPGCRKEY